MKVEKGELHFPGDPNAVPVFAGARVKGADISKLLGTTSSVTTTTTPATGSCTAQFVFLDSRGNPLTFPSTMTAYVSTIAGRQGTAVSGLAVATNGDVTSLVTGKIAIVTTDVTGKLGITLTASAGTYYITFVNEANGLPLTSGALVCN